MQIARLKSSGAINRSFFKHQSARETVFRYQIGVLCNPESKYNVMWQWKTKFVISFSYRGCSRFTFSYWCPFLLTRECGEGLFEKGGLFILVEMMVSVLREEQVH